VDKYCYLGDMIGNGGDEEKATRTRVRCEWGKFTELAPMLTQRGASLKMSIRLQFYKLYGKTNLK
jgi:hypothetical protein